MMNLSTEFEEAGFAGQSHFSVDGYRGFEGTFDVGLFCSSWDVRSTSVCDANIKIGRAVLLLFDNVDSFGYREKHDSLIKNYLAGVADDLQIVTGESTQIPDIWFKLRHVLGAWDLGSGLDVLIDACAMPRVYSLGLINLFLRTGLARKVSVLYSEGRYKGPSEGEYIHFTDGQWQATVIPGFEGEFDPGLDRHVVVCLGFEGGKTSRIVNKHDAPLLWNQSSLHRFGSKCSR